MTLGRTMNYKQHLVNTDAHIRTRINIVQELCDTIFGAPLPLTAACLFCNRMVFSTMVKQCPYQEDRLSVDQTLEIFRNE